MSDRRLGHNIELARRRAGLSREQLAGAIGKSAGMLGHYETGQHEPPLTVLRAIADATDTTLIRLLGVELSPADLLRLLAHQNPQFTGPNPGNPGPRMPSVLVGITINDNDE